MALDPSFLIHLMGIKHTKIRSDPIAKIYCGFFVWFSCILVIVARSFEHEFQILTLQAPYFLILFSLFLCFLVLEGKRHKIEEKYKFIIVFNRGGLWKVNGVNFRWVKWHFSNQMHTRNVNSSQITDEFNVIALFFSVLERDKLCKWFLMSCHLFFFFFSFYFSFFHL